MTRPTVPAVAELWYEELATAQPGDETRDWPLLLLLGAFGVAFGPLHDIVRDTDDSPGWASALDPVTAPAFALPWVAQFAGVDISREPDVDAQRELITSPPAFKRGTSEAMVAAVQRTLTGTKSVQIVERDGGPYNLTVTTRPDETPDAERTLAAIRSQKPAGLLLNNASSSSPLINEGTRTINASTGTIDNASLADIT